jgi:peroxiredoxin
MSGEQGKKPNNKGIIIAVAAVVILGALVLAFIKKNNNKTETANIEEQINTIKPESVETIKNTPEKEPAKTEPAKVEKAKIEASGPSREEIVSKIGSFGLAEIAPAWKGKEAPDFTLKDTDGKVHKLSDYRGKEVLVTFWATWCPPCQEEMPELISLRKSMSEDKLAILAISNESIVTLKTFKEKRGLNYTILQMKKMLGDPYNQVRYIPSAFFIDKKGIIKVAVTNAIKEESMKAIIESR